MEIIIFFIAHWFLALFFQTFFLHRYAAHNMFTMKKSWERIFFILTYVFQGSSFLNPRAYAIMHRMHHTFSDTKRDPHSPHFFKSVFSLMWNTKEVYVDLIQNKTKENEDFSQNVPTWPSFEKFTDKWFHRIVWGALYTAFYVVFAEAWYFYLLLPVHFVMGPVHGAIVNWCGHKYGYRNFNDTKDHSRNSLPVDFLTMGELFQNNHHRYPYRANFAVKKFEFDPTFPIIKLLILFGIIKLRTERY